MKRARWRRSLLGKTLEYTGTDLRRFFLGSVEDDAPSIEGDAVTGAPRGGGTGACERTVDALRPERRPPVEEDLERDLLLFGGLSVLRPRLVVSLEEVVDLDAPTTRTLSFPPDALAPSKLRVEVDR